MPINAIKKEMGPLLIFSLPSRCYWLAKMEGSSVSLPSSTGTIHFCHMNRKQIIEKTYSDPAARLALHIVFWLIMTAGYYYFNTISFNPSRGTPAAYLLAIKMTAVFAMAFYTSMYWIRPAFLLKKKWFRAFLAFFVLIIFVACIDAWSDKMIFTRCEPCSQQLALYSPDYYNFLKRNFPNIVFVRIVTGGLVYHLVLQISFPVAIKIGRDYFRQTVQQLELAKENLQLEFNFLKAQVNPHFLFNTLNNIYSLVMSERKTDAGASIARLSGLMRYTLYETGDEKIALDKEVQLLRDYMELEKLRLNEIAVDFVYEKDRDDYKILPLLLMPALENAFKFTTDHVNSQINISIKALMGELTVRIENHFDPHTLPSKGGIGLENLRKRLQHYFAGRSSMSSTAVNDVYLFQLSCALT